VGLASLGLMRDRQGIIRKVPKTHRYQLTEHGCLLTAALRATRDASIQQLLCACHEGALAPVDGKARLVKDTFCDGLGACIGECPQGALTIVEREASDFDAEAVEAARSSLAPAPRRAHGHAPGACPGAAMRSLDRSPSSVPSPSGQPPPSQLGHWPVQLMLVPPHAPFLKGGDLLVCADCVPFAVPDFHERYLAGRAVVVGCPKLDDLGHYREKLTAMVREARPRRITVARMEVPCCRGIAQISFEAARGVEPSVPVEEHVVGIRGGVEHSDPALGAR
jgi:ferredoxin